MRESQVSRNPSPAALGYTRTGQRREVGFDRVLYPEITLLPPD
jgi:hypothetical protein